ncbi:MAG: ABC transporter permease, partial [Acetobacteraceae bacterium]
WILPSATLAAFLVPKLTRVLAANVAEALREDHIRTARAQGAPPLTILLRHALPNALLGATALVGTQFAFLISGALTTEVIFAWPGLGQLLVASVQVLDFPVVQAAVFVIAVMVFAVNGATDVLFRLIDPRLRGR